MCYASPGPRCTPHAHDAMETAEKKVRTKIKAHGDLSVEISRAQETGQDTTILQARQHALESDLVGARRAYIYSRREYEATPGGSEELSAKIDKARAEGKTSDLERLERRQTAAKAVAGWRENALINMREGGRIPVARTKKYNNDGTLKFSSDGLGVVTKPSGDDDDLHPGSQVHSVRLQSADKLAFITTTSRAVALNNGGQVQSRHDSSVPHGWGYQVTVNYLSYDSVHDRDSTGTVKEDQETSKNYVRKVYANEQEANNAAKAHVTLIDPVDFSWDGESLSEETPAMRTLPRKAKRQSTRKLVTA